MPAPIDYGGPRRVWADDGHVIIESRDGTVVRMTPEIALEMGRRLSSAGSDALIHKITDRPVK